VADSVSLTSLPVLSTFRLSARIASDDGTTMAIELLQPSGAVHGEIDITKTTGVVVGALTVALEETLVEPIAIALNLDDVVMELSTGRTLVVRALGLGPNGDLWSDSTAGGTTYPSTGFTRVGTATLI
jgi:hypothetical protein